MESFDINRFFKVLFNSKLYIFLILLVFIAMGYCYSFYYVTPMFESSATVVLVQNDNIDSEESVSSITQSDIILNQNLLSTYTKIAKSDKVLERVISNLNINLSSSDLFNLITVEAVNNTELFKISVKNKDNLLASNITNELLNVFLDEVQSLYNMNNVYIMDTAEVSNVPYNINHFKDIFIFTLIGLCVSFGVVIVIYLIDTTIKSEQDVEDYANLPVLSTIPIYKNKQNKLFNELIVNAEPKSPIAECFKTFRTNIMFSIQNKQLSNILVTSSYMGEGKSFVSSNLAVSFAKSGKRVILVDTDMRKGRIHKIFSFDNTSGLSNLLSNIGIYGETVNINQYINKSNIPNLHIMTCGSVPPNPSELLSSVNMKKLLDALNTQYDIVICDGTPCMLVSDSVILSKIVDTTVIVTANKVTKIDNLLKIKKAISMVGGNIGGAVINKMDVDSKSYQNKYYYGNTDELTINFDMNDSVLDNFLHIDNSTKYTEVYDDTEEISVNHDYVSSYQNDVLDKLSNIITNNNKEISELKGLYKNVMQESLKNINKNNTSSVLREINNIKKLYEDNILEQNSQISALENRISNITLEDNSNVILNELNSIKTSYEDAINSQNIFMQNLDNKISNFNLNDYSNVILDELNNVKDAYENTINYNFEEISNKISSFKVEDSFDGIMNKLNSIRDSYEDAIKAQNEYITELNNKISSFKIEDQTNIILNALNNIKVSYEDATKIQSENIAELNNKISNFKIEENSATILKELGEIKASYENAISSQNEYMSDLNNRIASFKVGENSATILKELGEIKASYENAISSQNEYMFDLNNRIASFKVGENSATILKELGEIKASYENTVKSQNEYISRLEDKISNIKNEYSTELENKISSIKVEESSKAILNELNSIKTSYENAINSQNQYINALNEKIADLKSEDNSWIIFKELNNIKKTYDRTIESQNTEIANLNSKISKMTLNDKSDFIEVISSLYKEIEGINSRFDYLEKKTFTHDNIKNISTSNDKNTNVKNIDYINIDSKKVESKKLNNKKKNEKVVKIQDYFEKDYEITKFSENYSGNNINKVSILNNTPSKNTNKTKNKNGLFSFKSSNYNKQPINEDVDIVSQILSNNRKNDNESVG